MTIGTLLAFLALQAASQPVEERPSAIQRMIESRAAIRAGEVSWAVRNRTSTNAPDAWFSRRMRFVGGDSAYFDHGADGVTGFTESGEPAYQPVNELWSAEAHWEYGLGEIYAKKAPASSRPAHFPDLRAIALIPERIDGPDPAALIAAYPSTPGERRWRQRLVDGAYEVELEASDLSVRWQIDPARGWNVTRCELRRAGRVLRACECTLRDFGGTWFPDQVRYFYDGKTEPQVEFRIAEAKFDASPQVRPLTPADIGVEPGMSVNVAGARDGDEPQVWAGDRLVGAGEFLQLLREGKVQRGPTVQAFIDRTRSIVRAAQRSRAPDAPAATVAGEPPATSQPTGSAADLSEWEAYTRDFIQRFALNRDQMEKAIQILGDCQRQAREYLARSADAITKAEGQLAQPTEAGGPRQAEAQRELRRLRTPVDDIFEKQLKPRLDRIPTAAQRAAARRIAESAQSPATQTATPQQP